LQHVLAFDEPLPRHVGTPTARDFSQVSNRDIDGRTQVDGEVGFTRDLMVAQPDNLGTQRDTPESPHKNAGVRLINRLGRCHTAPEKLGNMKDYYGTRPQGARFAASASQEAL
jgi:hypothetical protein